MSVYDLDIGLRLFVIIGFITSIAGSAVLLGLIIEAAERRMRRSRTPRVIDFTRRPRK